MIATRTTKFDAMDSILLERYHAKRPGQNHQTEMASVDVPRKWLRRAIKWIFSAVFQYPLMVDRRKFASPPASSKSLCSNVTKGPIIAGRKNVAYHVQCLCMYEHGYTQDTSGQMVILFGRFRSFVIFVLILNCKEEL